MSDTDTDTPETDEKHAQQIGAKGGDDSPAADTLPGLPADDDSPLGDTDQHSKA